MQVSYLPVALNINLKTTVALHVIVDGKEEKSLKVLLGNLKESDSLKDLGRDERIILKCTINRMGADRMDRQELVADCWKHSNEPLCSTEYR
jgi:hypothetical protein